MRQSLVYHLLPKLPMRKKASDLTRGQLMRSPIPKGSFSLTPLQQFAFGQLTTVNSRNSFNKPELLVSNVRESLKL